MAPFLHLGCWWGTVFKLICLFTCLTAPSVHCKLQLKDVNQTATSVTITWTTPQDILKEINNFRLVISQERDGFSPNYIYARHDDPECSLRLSSCMLSNLRPNTPYKVQITIHLHNSTWVLSGEKMINTLPASHNHAHIDMEWWLMFVAAPLIAGCLLFLVAAVLCCRIWHCCCWRRGTTHHTDHQTAERTSSSASSDKVRRSESHATRQWVKDTFRAIDPDPPSTYDRPVVDYNSSYELTHNSSSTTVIGLTRELQSSFKMKCKASTGIGKPAPSVQPPPVPSTQPPSTDSTPTHYLNTTALKQSVNAAQNLYENNVTPKQLPSGSRNPQDIKVSSAALYTNTEDLDKLLGNSRKMFTML